MPPPVTLTFDLLTLKSVWGTPVQSFVFLGLLVFELEPMYATSDRQTDRRTTDADHRLMPPPPTGREHNNRPVKRLPLVARLPPAIYIEPHADCHYSFITARCDASAVFAVMQCPFVCLSVRHVRGSRQNE